MSRVFLTDNWIYRKVEWLEQSVLYLLANGGGGGGGITSVFGRSGPAITAQSGDYTFSQIGNKPTTLSGYGITDAIGSSDTRVTNAILQGGNSFGSNLAIGTNDNYGINFKINGTTRSYLDNSGSLVLDNIASGNGITLYNTSDQTTNYEKAQIYWSGNILNINTGLAGTGVSRAMVVGRATRLTLDNFSGATGAANLGVGNYNSSAPIFSIIGTLTSSSLMTPAFGPLITVNQTGSAGYRALWIPVYEQAIGGGDRLLIDAGTSTGQYGSGYTSKFSVSSSGNVYMPGTLTQTKNVTTSVGLGAGAYFNAYAYSGTGSQWASSFHTMTTVSGQSTVSELDGLLTALYHSAGFTLPKWKGIETGAVYVSGAGSVITESWGIEGKFPEVSNGGTVGTAACIHIPSQATTGITNPFAIFNEGTSSIMSRGAIEQYNNTTATVKGQLASDVNGGYFNLWGSSSVLIRLDGRGNNSYINTGGNFGIGTASPGSLFSVANTFKVDVTGDTNIGTGTKEASAILQINSNTQGFLPSKMTETQKNAISSPAEGLLIYQTDGSKGWYGFNGSSWVILN